MANRRWRIAGAVVIGLALQVVWLAILLPPRSTPPAAESWSAESDAKAKIDPKTGDGTPDTIVWNGRAYAFTHESGSRSYLTYSSYSEAVQAMIFVQREKDRKWTVAPKPTPEPLSSPSPSTSPSQWTSITTVPLTYGGNYSTAIATLKPAPTPLRLYQRDQAENWMTVIPLDPEKDRSWAHDNVKIETRAKPFVRRNTLTGGWTIEFVSKGETSNAQRPTSNVQLQKGKGK
jgi:hypothetical protein